MLNAFNKTMDQKYNNNNLSNISKVDNELLYVQMLPGVISIILLTVAIAHPVYAVLFCNLLITLVSSIIDVFIFPFITILKYTNLVSRNSIMCVLFHCCSWCILSVLRYQYIVNTKWVHEKFPNPKTICALAIFALFFIFIFTFGTVLGTLVLFGWPYKKFTDLTGKQRMAIDGTVLTTYFLLVGTSCFIYILILRKRGKLGINHVGILDKDSVLKNEAMESNCSSDRLNKNNIKSTAMNQKSTTKPEIKLSHFPSTNPRSVSNKSLVEKTSPKTKMKERSLSYTEISNNKYDDNFRIKIHMRRSKSYEEMNIRNIDTHLELEKDISRSNVQQSADIQVCNVMPSDEEVENCFELEAERIENEKKIERRNAEINAAVRYFSFNELS
jgi:hypothetical protein